jgi:hypothetical protein
MLLQVEMRSASIRKDLHCQTTTSRPLGDKGLFPEVSNRLGGTTLFLTIAACEVLAAGAVLAAFIATRI